VLPPRSRGERWLTVVALTVTVVGVLAVLFVGYLLAFSNLQADRHQRLILSRFGTDGGRAALAGRVLAEGQPAAVLVIPALHLHLVVVEGTSSADLQSGPGLMPGTAPPGVRGNTVIAGHRLTFGRPFDHLLALRAGDRITLTGSDGTFGYRVTKVGVATPGSADPVAPSPNARLTLVTSVPYPQAGREFVVASMIGHPVAVPRYVVTRPTRELALNGDPSAVLPTALWALALAAGVVLTVLAYRRSRHTLLIYLLSTPALLALSVGCFQSLSRLLPPTL